MGNRGVFRKFEIVWCSWWVVLFLWKVVRNECIKLKRDYIMVYYVLFRSLDFDSKGSMEYEF